MNRNLRTDLYKRTKALDELLHKVNDLLEEIEITEIAKLTQPKLPTVFIVGNPRSGTTLLYQWLASTGIFAYPSNLMSRLYKAPYVGGLLHKIFIDYDKHGELCGNKEFEFVSMLGKTKGAHSPHEFWFFWRRFFHFGNIQWLDKAKLKKVNHELFLKELAAIEHCFEKPLLLKALIMNWNIDYLNRILKKPLFLFIQREPVSNMASLYKARKLFFNDQCEWYSFKPPEYESLKTRNVYFQLAGQVYYTNEHIQKALHKIQPGRSFSISYEKFCEAPEAHYQKIVSLLLSNGYDTDQPYTGPASFQPSLNFVNDFNVAKAKEALSCISAS